MVDPTSKTNKKRHPARHCEREIARAFLRLADFSDGVVNKLLDRVFVVVKRGISFKLMMTCAGARLSDCDERIYECYSGLMARYKEAAAIFEENGWDEEAAPHAPDAGVREILRGVHAVIASRLQANGANENPITLEKREIVNSGIQIMTKNMDALWRRFEAQTGADLAKEYREANITRFGMDTGMAVMSGITRETLNRCGDGFRAASADAGRFCLSRLNDINSRAATTYYFDLLGKELEILTTLVKVQFTAIEREMGRLKDYDKTAVEAALNKISGAYQIFSKGANDIIARFQEEENKPHVPPPEDAEGFMAFLTAQTENAQMFPTHLFQQWEKESEGLLTAFGKHADRAIACRLREKTSRLAQRAHLYNLQKSVAEHALMSREIMGTFAGISDWRKEHGPPPEGCALTDIIEGVCDTIDIKVESLAENEQRFTEECRNVFNQAITDAPDISAGRETASQGAEALLAAMIEAYNKDGAVTLRTVRTLLDGCIDGCGLAPGLDQANKALESRKETIAKKTLAFKRDALLYEMSTFEEIMNYSVSRLRESGDPYVTQFVVVVDEAVKLLFAILNKNNISAIAPQPHEPFNGKEQEVLLAEKDERFQKGEVIKVMNRGYKQDGVVLVRANVIAAK